MAPLDSEELWQTLLGHIRTGKTLGTAARAVGMHRRAVLAYLKGRADRAAEYVEAEQEATEAVEERIYEAAQAGERWACELWVKSKAPDVWDRKALAGSGGGSVAPVLDPAALAQLNSGSGAGVKQD